MDGTLDRERLARVLGLLGSAHDGEVVAAARQAERIRRDAGATWRDIIVPTLPEPIRTRDIESASDAIEFCLRCADWLNEWEVDFIISLARQRYQITLKQLNVLQRLVEKCRRAERTAA